MKTAKKDNWAGKETRLTRFSDCLRWVFSPPFSCCESGIEDEGGMKRTGGWEGKGVGTRERDAGELVEKTMGILNYLYKV